MRVLVLSLTNHRGAFAAVRRLHEAGWIVSVGTSTPNGLVSWSRHTQDVFSVPRPELGYDRFLDAVAAAAKASRAEVVIPTDDADTIALSLGRDRISAIVPFAPHDALTRVVDKLSLMEAARSAGLAETETLPADESNLRRAVFPVVIKPRFHWLPDHPVGVPARIAATVCADHASAAAAAATMREQAAEPLIQKWVSGDLVSVHLVADGATVMSLTQQHSPPLFFPPGAGVRVRSTVVPTDPDLEAGIRKLIADIGWYGIAGLQFLREGDGIPRLIDFNGRIPGSLEAVAGAGPNYVAAWAAMATGRPAHPLPSARPGTRCQWLEGDLRRALKEQRGGVFQDVAHCLVYSIGATHTVLKRDEPYAVLRYTLAQLREAQRHRSARRSRRRQ